MDTIIHANEQTAALWAEWRPTLHREDSRCWADSLEVLTPAVGQGETFSDATMRQTQLWKTVLSHGPAERRFITTPCDGSPAAVAAELEAARTALFWDTVELIRSLLRDGQRDPIEFVRVPEGMRKSVRGNRRLAILHALGVPTVRTDTYPDAATYYRIAREDGRK